MYRRSCASCASFRRTTSSKDAPFSRIDVLSCRNLLIYLNTELQNRVIPIFHFSLRPGGVLFLGSSENVTRHQKLFAPIDRRRQVFRKLETAARIIPDFPPTSRIHNSDSPPETLAAPVPTGRITGTIGGQAEAIAGRYAPAYVVVDVHGNVLHFSGRMGRYLEPRRGRDAQSAQPGASRSAIRSTLGACPRCRGKALHRSAPSPFPAGRPHARG